MSSPTSGGFSTPAPTASTASQTPQATEEVMQDASKIPTTTSLLFGFLVSFLGLFIVFVGWGLASRYMMDRRRERLAYESDLLEGGVQKGSKPPLWDVWVVPGHETWGDMMPLSVELRGPSTTSPSVPPDHEESSTPGVEFLDWYHGFGRSGLPFTTPRRTQPRGSVPFASQDSGTPKAKSPEGPLELQIAVLVAMPSLTSRTRGHTSSTNGKRTSIEGLEHRQDTEEMSDIAVGVTAIPWDKERMDFG